MKYGLAIALFLLLIAYMLGWDDNNALAIISGMGAWSIYIGLHLRSN